MFYHQYLPLSSASPSVHVRLNDNISSKQNMYTCQKNRQQALLGYNVYTACWYVYQCATRTVKYYAEHPTASHGLIETGRST